MTERVQLWVLFDFPKGGKPPERRIQALFKWALLVLSMRVVKCRLDDPPKEAGTAGTDGPPAGKRRRKRRGSSP
jgi:hypothetical protein